MFRKQLPRFYELVDVIPNRSDPNTYFNGFEKELQGNLRFLDFQVNLEKELQCLDHAAWEFLKNKAKPHVIRYGPDRRGHEQLFNHLNGARAYCYLKMSMGCSRVKFLPESDKKTPDLEGIRDVQRVLCEVKTLNPSDDEIQTRHSKDIVAVDIDPHLKEGFLRKLDAAIAQAKCQLETYDPNGEAQHLTYINVDFDEAFGHFYGDYRTQIRQRVPGSEVVFWCITGQF